MIHFESENLLVIYFIVKVIYTKKLRSSLILCYSFSMHPKCIDNIISKRNGFSVEPQNDEMTRKKT